MADIADLRREYTQGGLQRENLPDEPHRLFRQWFDEACTAELLEPNAMILATVDGEQRPSTRTVLLKAQDASGFVFYTNYDSRKAREIAANPAVSATFPWLALERQVNLHGTAEPITRAESLQYFLSRPFGSRLGAWVSQQSRVISSRQVLEAKLEEMKRKFADGEVPLPGFWGGYRIVPRTVEFWQGRPNRLHDRFQYQRDTEGWKIARLSP